MAYFENRNIPKEPKRSNDDYFLSSRSELVNHLKTEVKKKPGHNIGDFLTTSLWSWIYHYFKSRFGKKFPYPGYSNPETGIYTIPSDSETVIGIASDWATDTEESFEIADKIKTHSPDYTIHVGDTYYVGAPFEVSSNFTEEGAPWVRGRQGSFAVLGNHEMYARGDAFFETLLPTLGTVDSNGGYTGQKAGFFCLQNDHWRILGLDTGYHSTGIPLIEFIPWFAPNCHFDEKQIEWLRDVVKLSDPSDKRGILILTHHQIISAFKTETEYSKPAGQLATLVGKEKKLVWLWGHEHKLSFYGQSAIDKGPKIYGRCIGHGGTPIEISGKSFQPASKNKGFNPLVAFDQRKQKMIGDKELGYNGYALIKTKNSQLSIEYYDNKSFLISETWNVDLTTGEIKGSIVPPENCQLILREGKAWSDAVR
jgi:hypothetical protein